MDQECRHDYKNHVLEPNRMVSCEDMPSKVTMNKGTLKAKPRARSRVVTIELLSTLQDGLFPRPTSSLRFHSLACPSEGIPSISFKSIGSLDDKGKAFVSGIGALLREDRGTWPPFPPCNTTRKGSYTIIMTKVSPDTKSNIQILTYLDASLISRAGSSQCLLHLLMGKAVHAQ